MHTPERKLPVLGKGGELPAERSYSIGLAEAVGEESDAKWRYQQVVPKAKSAGKLFSTSGASLRFQTVTNISSLQHAWLQSAASPIFLTSYDIRLRARRA
jgi:hypothetical protein